VLKDHLDRRGELTLFLSLDFESDQAFFYSQASLIKKIQLEIGDKGGYVFIDEIHRKEGAALFLKSLHDLITFFFRVLSTSLRVFTMPRYHRYSPSRGQYNLSQDMAFADAAIQVES